MSSSLQAFLSKLSRDKKLLDSLRLCKNSSEAFTLVKSLAPELTEQELFAVVQSRMRGWDNKRGWMGIPYHLNACECVRKSYESISLPRNYIFYK